MHLYIYMYTCIDMSCVYVSVYVYIYTDADIPVQQKICIIISEASSCAMEMLRIAVLGSRCRSLRA